jgi:hypothetical protein
LATPVRASLVHYQSGHKQSCNPDGNCMENELILSFVETSFHSLNSFHNNKFCEVS